MGIIKHRCLLFRGFLSSKVLQGLGRSRKFQECHFLVWVPHQHRSVAFLFEIPCCFDKGYSSFPLSNMSTSPYLLRGHTWTLGEHARFWWTSSPACFSELHVDLQAASSSVSEKGCGLPGPGNQCLLPPPGASSDCVHGKDVHPVRDYTLRTVLVLHNLYQWTSSTDHIQWLKLYTVESHH